MAIDIIGIILIILFFIRGYMKGFIVAIFSVLAILLGILCALKLSQAFSGWLLEKKYITSGWVQVISYVILFVGVVILVNLLARLIQRALEGVMLGTVNRLIGGLLYAFLGIVLWSSLLWIGARMNIISHETLEGSKTYAWISGLAPWFFFEAGRLIPFVQDTFDKLEHFFKTINQKQA
jgi:membrane protein required for colicin V production